MSVWTKDNIPNLSGKTVIVTGANSGIGYETALALAEKEALVILAVRNVEKGKAAIARIKAVYADAKVNVMSLDLSDLASIWSFAESFLQQYSFLSLLINNAGIMIPPLRRTKDGFESQFGTNHLGHFALTGLLLESLMTTPESRVITVSSLAAYKGKIAFNNLDGSKGYKAMEFYRQSKLANLLFTMELQNKFTANQINTISIACHPGVTHTNLASRDSGKQLNKFFQLLSKLITQPANMGALPTIYAATEPTLKGGEYIGPDGKNEWKGYPKILEHNLYDAEISNKLWSISEELTGISYDFKRGSKALEM